MQDLAKNFNAQPNVSSILRGIITDAFAASLLENKMIAGPNQITILSYKDFAFCKQYVWTCGIKTWGLIDTESNGIKGIAYACDLCGLEETEINLQGIKRHALDPTHRNRVLLAKLAGENIKV